MRGSRALAVLFVVVLAAAPLAPLAPPDPAGEPADRTRGALDSLGTLEERLDRFTEGSDPPADPVEGEVLVVLRLKRGAEFPTGYPVEVRERYTREGARHLRGYVPLSEVGALSTDPRVEAVRIERSRLSSNHYVADGVAAVGADQLHARGVTGSNVTVGVIDSAFRVSDPEIAGNVAASRSFESTGDGWEHGTAVASVVVDTAPDARLHLAAVGTSTTPEEYREAVDWLRESGADVIVDAGSYFGQPADGSGELAAIAAEASRDTVLVAAAGNYGTRHWEGTHNGSGQVVFDPETGATANPLADGEPFSGPVRVSVHWTDPEADYELSLLRGRPGSGTVVARGTGSPDAPVEHLVATVPRGRYYLALRAVNGSGTGDNSRGEGDATSATVGLFASHDLRYRSTEGSLTAPGTAPGVLTVGALTERGEVAAFSSRGPVSGERVGVDLVAPDSVAVPGTGAGNGTSFAAPYVAGTAALIVDAHPSLSPAEVRSVLRSSATDVGAPGPDVDSGYGRLDAVTAERLARVQAQLSRVEERERVRERE
jgi:hypothetical protein